MIQIIEDNLDSLKMLCHQYQVSRLEIFGSAVEGSFDPEVSDLDFLVEFNHVPDLDAANQYFGLLFDIETLFKRPVDLVCATAMRNEDVS